MEFPSSNHTYNSYSDCHLRGGGFLHTTLRTHILTPIQEFHMEKLLCVSFLSGDYM
jgi:hypothetical protein